jgi:hypothetical protein
MRTYTREMEHTCFSFMRCFHVVHKQTRNKLKNTVFWDVMPCGSCKNQRFGGNYSPPHQGENTQQAENFSSNKPRGPQSASELYRLGDCHLWAKFSANFCG